MVLGSEAVSIYKEAIIFLILRKKKDKLRREVNCTCSLDYKYKFVMPIIS